MGYHVFNISIVCLYHRLTNKERKSENRELPDNRAWMAWQGGEWPSIISNTLFFIRMCFIKMLGWDRTKIKKEIRKLVRLGKKGLNKKDQLRSI